MSKDKVLDGMSGQQGDTGTMLFNVVSQDFDKVTPHEPVDRGRREGGAGGLGFSCAGDSGDLTHRGFMRGLLEGFKEVRVLAEQPLAELVDAEGVGAVAMERGGVLLTVDYGDGADALLVEGDGGEVAGGAGADDCDLGGAEGWRGLNGHFWRRNRWVTTDGGRMGG